MANKKLRAALLGFGGMGHCHASQYPNQEAVELVAICDINPDVFLQESMTINLGDSGTTDLSRLLKFTSYEEMVRNCPDLDMIDICLPTDLHAKYAIQAMEDGFHVLCEKPMALNTEDCDKMIAASRRTGKSLMIAQCLRFAEDYNIIKDAVQNQTYGKLLKLDMSRYGAYPGGWFREVDRSGGALLDLHLHDADFLMMLLGKPQSIHCRGFVGISGGVDDAIVEYNYPDGPIVTVSGGWTHTGFAATLTAVFEKATLELKEGKCFHGDFDRGVCTELPLPGKGNPYFNEIAYFATCVQDGLPIEIASMESTRDTIDMVRKEELSILSGKDIDL